MSDHISGRKAILILTLATVLIGGHFYLRFVVEPGEEAWSEALKRVSPQAVTRISVEPTGQLYSTKDSFEITDLVAIELFCELLTASHLYSPSHPNVRWECQLTIETSDQRWIIEIHETENSGVLAYVHSGATLRNDNFSAIRQLVDAHKNQGAVQ